MYLHPDSEDVVKRYGRLWTRTDGNAANCNLQCVLSLHRVLERIVWSFGRHVNVRISGEEILKAKRKLFFRVLHYGDKFMFIFHYGYGDNISWTWNIVYGINLGSYVYSTVDRNPPFYFRFLSSNSVLCTSLFYICMYVRMYECI